MLLGFVNIGGIDSELTRNMDATTRVTYWTSLR